MFNAIYAANIPKISCSMPNEVETSESFGPYYPHRGGLDAKVGRISNGTIMKIC